MSGQQLINGLKYQWQALIIFQAMALAAGCSLFIGSLINHFLFSSAWVYLIVFLIVFFIYSYIKPVWKINKKYIIRYLNSNFPQLEESSALLIKPVDKLGPLEQLQVKKISLFINDIKLIVGAKKQVIMSIIAVFIGLTTFTTLKFVPANAVIAMANNTENLNSQLPIKEDILPQVSSYRITIIPPAYTLKAARTQQHFYISAELGAKVTWNIQTNKKIQSFYVIFNDKEKLKLSPSNSNGNTWIFNKRVKKQGYYQLEMDGVKSDLYQIEVIPDLPVQIKIIQPKPQTTIDIGQAAKIDVTAMLTDDYGITNAFINATMASGKGESVSFTAKKLNFNSAFNNQKSNKLSKYIDLKSLGMKPGDELYFYLEAKDNKGQQSRSDVYYVSIVETAELMSMSGMTSGVNLVPEYFRSERQIIIDTEKLLATQAKLPVPEFNRRSNELGIEQKLLRMRYGQFLGEENETAIGEAHEDHDDHDEHEAAPEKFGDVQSIMDKYAHKHDTAEDPTFFEPAIKAQLKAVLAEMWKAELKLRIHQPQEALPFEYKALRLLKDLQQKSRAYVAKTTVKTSSLKPEKRLTGELDKVTEPQQIFSFTLKNEVKKDLKLLLALLGDHQKGKTFSANEKALLQMGERQMIAAAINQPSTYLTALKSLRKLYTQNSINQKDVVTVANAIYQLIGIETTQPQPLPSGTSSKLSDSYFNYLQKH